ncbi:MAG: putative cytokinetic ring protein SteA [Armatimonadetes bacterium]|nr:putative cytokinetic ring protein SteA [Armatimonadota bacterium]MDW8029422.1 putative cytokinetic ring protein SteA [Armatimonadota bacterium]
MVITGILKKDRRTKNLVRRLKRGDVALLNHPDLDLVAAESLLKTGIAAIVNSQPTLTGQFPSSGALLLLRQNIPIVDLSEPKAFEELIEGKIVTIDLDEGIVRQNGKVFTVKVLTEAEVKKKLKEAEQRLSEVLESFVKNTMTYLSLEGKQLLSSPITLPNIKTKIAGHHALIVVRGHRYREDLLAVRSYIRDRKPILIGVDGGADALLELGYRPDIIIGDMDSVSEKALQCGAELIVHAYPDGRAPGLERVKKLGLNAHVFPIVGTSEDAAMLLAYEGGAELIVAVGTHSSLVEFLEKGRQGMASTFLTRLKVGHKLVDAKGVSELYTSGIRWWHIFLLTIVGAAIGVGLILLSPTLQTYLRPIWLWLWTSLEHLFR